MRPALALLLCVAGAWAQGRGNRQANEITLGLVVFEKKGKVVVAEALAGSPAKKAGVKAGDVVVKLGPRPIKRHNDIDRALRKWRSDRKIEIDLIRKGKKLSLMTSPVLLADFRHAYLKPAARGRTGFPAPAWHAFAWANVPRGRRPPTLANTRGKVVVIHCFQRW